MRCRKMMVAPLSIYNELKGKSVRYIRAKISELRKEMKQCRDELEAPKDSSYECMHPDPKTRLFWTREYLTMAKIALAEVGGTCRETPEEFRDDAFNEKMGYISKASLKISGGFSSTTKTADLSKTALYFVTTKSHKPDFEKREKSHEKDRDDFITEMQELHIGEWEKEYVDRYVLDGMQWSLEIEFQDIFMPFKVYGSNAFPYNFNELKNLFEITDED